MAKLTEPVKLFIVQHLACFDPPTMVATSVKEEFGLDILRQQVAQYDPTKATGRDVSKKLRAVFEAARKAFLEDVNTIPIANQAVRLRRLERLSMKAEAQGNAVLAAQLIEQAAKEKGGAFTNRRELTGARGGPIQATTQTSTLTPEEFRDIAKQVADEV